MIHYLNTESQNGHEMWHSELLTLTCMYMICCLCHVNRPTPSTVCKGTLLLTVICTHAVCSVHHLLENIGRTFSYIKQCM